MKDIIGYEGLYWITCCGKILNKRGNELKPINVGNDYLSVSLYKNKHSKRYYIHRLVAQHYISNPLNLPEVNHLDGIKSNCHVLNLEWSTHSNNMKHAYRTGLINNFGENQTNSKLKEIDINNIKSLKNTLSRKEIATQFNVSYSHVNAILRNEKWKHIK